MKIIAELIRVRQEWDPETNTHSNSVIFGFGGMEVEVAASPEQVRQIILAAQEQRSHGELRGAPAEAEPDEALDDALASELVEDEEVLFGGDYSGLDPNQPVDAPATFQGLPDPSVASTDAALGPQVAPAPSQTPTQQREATIAARRVQDPAQRRKDEKGAMRARAKAMPMRRVAKDDMGYPIEQPKSAHIAGPVGHPEVVRRPPSPTVATGGDDDGFAQG